MMFFSHVSFHGFHRHWLLIFFCCRSIISGSDTHIPQRQTDSLSNIQIWGKPNWSVDKKVQKDIQSIWQALITAKSNPSQDTLQSEKITEQKTARKRNLTDPDTTPEEFLDALTCKRM